MHSGGRPSPRVALVLQGDPADSRAWSGIPSGVSSGLVAAGAEPIPIQARFPGEARLAQVLRMSWLDQVASRPFAAVSGRRASTSIEAAGGIDGVVMIGSGYSLSVDAPVVTYEDMTVAQAMAQPDSPFGSVGKTAERRWRQRQARNYRHSRGCCVASHWAARSIQYDYGIEEAKIHVVGFGRNSEPQRVERDWQVPRFIFIGMDWERKRGAVVVEAFARVRERHPKATLDLVGRHPPIEAPGVTGHGILSLRSSEESERKAALLRRATCLVLPSANEPFGIAYLDAGAAGVPSIGTTSGGAPDAVGDGGLLVDPGDGDGLASAMLELADPKTARRLGERAFAHSALYTWQAVSERLLRALGL